MKIPKTECSDPSCVNEFDPEFHGVQCQFCSKIFCDSCIEDDIVKCENCGIKECKDCMNEDKETGLYFCGSLCVEDYENY